MTPEILPLYIHIKWIKNNNLGTVCMRMFTKTLFTKNQVGKQAKCTSTDEWVSQLCYMCIMEHLCSS